MYFDCTEALHKNWIQKEQSKGPVFFHQLLVFRSEKFFNNKKKGSFCVSAILYSLHLCSQRGTIVKNVQFVGEKVIGRIFSLYQQHDVTLPRQLQTVQMNFRQIKW